MRIRPLRRPGRIATAASVLAVTAAAASLATPAAATAAGSDPTTPPPVPATPGALIHGVGHFTYEEPGLQGHRIRFRVHARVDAEGTTRGTFDYRHLLPDGEVLGAGHAEVTCLSVHGDTALVAAVVPEGHGNVRNHGYYLKIIDGNRAHHPDQIETVQAQNGPDRPPRHCIDTAVDPDVKRYPIDRGGYLIRP